MEKIFAKSEEKYVQSIVVYGHSGMLYMDAEAAATVSPLIVKDLFIKHCLVIYDEDVSKYVYPVAMELDDDGIPTNIDAMYIDGDTVTPIQYTFG